MVHESCCVHPALAVHCAVPVQPLACVHWPASVQPCVFVHTEACVHVALTVHRSWVLLVHHVCCVQFVNCVSRQPWAGAMVKS